MSRADLDAERQEFEIWRALGKVATLAQVRDVYFDEDTAHDWATWQAALASQVPAVHKCGECDGRGFVYWGEGNPGNGFDIAPEPPVQECCQACGGSGQEPSEGLTVPQEPVGIASAGMPGTNGGFTMCVFKAVEVPVGTKLYAAPSPQGDADLIKHLEKHIKELKAENAGLSDMFAAAVHELDVVLVARSPQGDAEDAVQLALQRVVSSLRGAGAQLPTLDVKGTIESSMNTGMCIALSIVESEIAAIDSARKEGES
jgi:hypothetical protein